MLALGGGGGTGTLIAPTWVLTAGHNCAGASSLEKGDVVEIGPNEYRIVQVVLYPDHRVTADQVHHGVDLALLELDRPVNDVQPIPIYVGSDEREQTSTIVGFGFTGSFDTGHPSALTPETFEPIKRAGTNVIVQASDKYAFLKTRIDTSDAATELEAALAAGDSGAPALLDINGGSYVAVLIAVLGASLVWWSWPRERRIL